MKQERRSLIAILAASTVTMSTLTLAPIVAKAAMTFPDKPIMVVQLLVTLSSLLSMIFAIVTGMLAARISKKILLLVSLGLMLLGGLAPLLCHDSFPALLICSGIIGVGAGGVLTLSPALVTELMPQQMRNRAMGYQSMSVTFGGMIFTVLSGVLADIVWYAAYASFALLIPLILIVWRCLPPLAPSPAEREGGSGSALKSFSAWYLCGFNFLFSVFITVYNANIALILLEANVESASVSGLASAIFSLGGVAAGMIGGRVLDRLDAHALPASTFLAAAGMLLISFRSLPSIFLGSALAGMAFALRGAAGFIFAARAIPAGATLAIAMFSSGGAVGQFATSFVVNPIAGFISSSVSCRFATAGVLLLVLACIVVASNPCRKE